MADFPAEGNDHNDEQNDNTDVSSDHNPNQAHFAFSAGNIEVVEVPMMPLNNNGLHLQHSFMINNVNQVQMDSQNEAEQSNIMLVEPETHPVQDPVQVEMVNIQNTNQILLVRDDNIMLVEPEVQPKQDYSSSDKTNKAEIAEQEVTTQEACVQALSLISPSQMDISGKQTMTAEGSSSQKTGQLADQIISGLKTIISNLAHQALAPSRCISVINIPTSSIRLTLNDHGLESIQLTPVEGQGANIVTTAATFTVHSTQLLAARDTERDHHGSDVYSREHPAKQSICFANRP